MAIYGINYINESMILDEATLKKPPITLDEAKHVRDVFKKHLAKDKECNKFTRVFDDANIEKRFKDNKNRTMIAVYTYGYESTNIQLKIRDIFDSVNSELSNSNIKVEQEHISVADALLLFPAYAKLFKMSNEGGWTIYAKKIK